MSARALRRSLDRDAIPFKLADPRPEIIVAGGGLHTQTSAAAEVLGTITQADPMRGVFRRGTLLTRALRVVAAFEKGGIAKAAGSLSMAPADLDYLRLRLTETVRFNKYDKRSADFVPTNCPRDVCESLIAAAEMWDAIPRLTGIIEAPTLRPDGSVLDRPGYDEETGLLFDAGSTRFDEIPERPTKEQAKQALGKLLKVYKDFPFTDEASRAVAVSTSMTAVLRKPMRAAPLTLFSAPKMASGKSLLATVASLIATGRPPAMMNHAEDPESERKRLLSLLMEGPPIIVIDNVEQPLQSDALCSILTEPVFSDRLLGVNKTVAVPTNVTFYANGNNVTVLGDLSSRTLVCEIDPGCERPEEREFALNLHEYVPAHRGELAAAALTIARAYIVAGEPKLEGVANFGRFEDWCRLVRYPLIWLGMADPVETRIKIMTRDPVSTNLGNLLEAWREVFGKSAQTIAEAVNVSSTTALDDVEKQTRYAALREALEAMGDDGRGGINTKMVAKQIQKHEKRMERGLRFVRHYLGAHNNTVRWRALARDEQ